MAYKCLGIFRVAYLATYSILLLTGLAKGMAETTEEAIPQAHFSLLPFKQLPVAESAPETKPNLRVKYRTDDRKHLVLH